MSDDERDDGWQQQDDERQRERFVRLMTRVRFVGDCWIWSGSVGNSGYGKLRFGKTRDVSTHRLSYSLFHGPIPLGMCVLHRCDTRRCINPDHLFAGTKADNAQDMVSKGRQFSPARSRTACPKGHPYSGINSQGRRICRVCQRAATLAHYYRTKNERTSSVR